MSKSFSRPVYILGSGKSPVGHLNNPTPEIKDMSDRELTAYACKKAYDDAGIKARDVEKVIFGNVADWFLGEGVVGSSTFEAWMGCQGKPMTHQEEGCATGYMVLGDAIEAVASGKYDIVLAVSSDLSSSFFRRTDLPYMTRPHNEFTFAGGPFSPMWQGVDPAYHRWMGATENATNDMGGYIYMEDYGKTAREIDDYLNAIVDNARYNAVHNEDAMYDETFDQIAKEKGFETAAEYLKSDQNPVISIFLRRFSLLTHIDGAGAVIVCSEDVAKKSTKKRIKVLGTGFSTMPTQVHRNYQKMNRMAADIAFAQAGIKPEEIEYLQCTDMTSTEVLHSCEDVGYLPAGEGWKYHMEGRTRLDGDKPMNANGGSLSNGHAYSVAGLSSMHETVKQMRGEAGNHQVKKGAPRTALIRGTGGGHTTGVFILATED
jgi:acetyl-CoA C-acetyltransferase